MTPTPTTPVGSTKPATPATEPREIATSADWAAFLTEYRANRCHVEVFQRAMAAMNPAARPRRLADLGVDEVEALLEHSFFGGDSIYRDQVIDRLSQIDRDRAAGPRQAAAERDEEAMAIPPGLSDPDAQYLAYDDEAVSWSVMTIKQIKEAFEHALQTGDGRPSKIWALDRDPASDPLPLTVHHVATRTEDDWVHSAYQLRDSAGAVYNRFTTETDGRV